MPGKSKSRKAVSSAGRRTSSLPPEIWRIVAEQILGRKTLQALVQVCRLFRDVFRPFLHAKYTIDLSLHEPTALAQKTLPACLAYTKEFDVEINEFRQTARHPGLIYHTELNDGYAAFVARSLKAMPNLRSIRLLNSSYDDKESCLIFNNEEFLATLRSCVNLRYFLIQFPDSILDDEMNSIKKSFPLKGFRNLASLELYQFYDEETELVKNIAYVLRDCPTLKKLGLGMCCEFDCEINPEVVSASGNCDFLEELCLKYGTLSSPLPLETLRLGHGMFVHKSRSSSSENYIRKLVKLQDVKTLHIYNGLVHETDDWDLQPTPMRVRWKYFAECTSLFQLSVTRLDKQVRRWLNTSGRSVQELLVTEHSSMYDDDLDNFDVLQLPHLSVIFTREMTVSSRAYSGVWRALDHDSRPQVTLARESISVLDRLPLNIGNLTKVGICIELESQWVHFLSLLPKMRCLTYLRMDGRSHRSGRYPAPSTSLWPGVTRPKDIAKRYVQLMRSQCPSLQYVCVRHYAWQITSPLPGVPVREAAADRKVELRELEWEERMGIEIFCLASFAEQSGLPGPDYYHEELSEEDHQRMEQAIAEVERRIAAGDHDMTDLGFL